MRIQTDRLVLIPASLESLRAELESPGDLAAIVRADVPGNWPPDLYDRDPIEWTIQQLTLRPESKDWLLHYFALKSSSSAPEILIGCGGYKGAPTEDGTVEIGYSVLEQHRRQGYASEAALGLVRRAFADATVQRVIAETLPELDASIGVLRVCGFSQVAQSSAPGIIRFELPRSRYSRTHHG